MQGKVTCNDEPVDGAVVRIAAKDNKYVTYSATTTADGSYSISVVKIQKTTSPSLQVRLLPRTSR